MMGGRRLRKAALGLLLLFTACEPGRDPDLRPPDEPPVPPARETAPAAARRAGTERFAGALAVTIDDLPWVGPLPPGETRVEATRRLLSGLTEHDAPATGFVNCGRSTPDDPVLRLWLDAGLSLGNHTDAHLDLNRAPVGAWFADARSCDAFLRELTGEASIFFRYPYLHRGRTAETYSAARRALDRMGARIAPVTIDTSDWILAAAYGDALRAGDEARARAIGRALVEHVLRQARHYRRVAHDRLGRDVAHVLLLHANALNADYLDDVLERLRAEDFRFVPLDEALEDPVYALPDDYIGPEGLSWLYRFRPAMPELAAWDDREAARLRAMFPQ